VIPHPPKVSTHTGSSTRSLSTLGAALLLLAACGRARPGGEAADTSPDTLAWPAAEWTRSTPEEEGLDPAPLHALDQGIRDGRFGWVDRLVVVRHGRLLRSERYENDYVQLSRGRSGPLGCGTDACPSPEDVHDYNYLHPDIHPYYRGRDVHSLQSVTKSVSATVLAAAIHQGAIVGVEAPLLPFFGDYDLSGVDPRLHEATLADLLTMRSGIEWHEQDRPLDETNTTLQLERSQDWIQFTLDQPMDAAPGEKWAYSSGGSHLMSGVVRAATGSWISDYAEAHVFSPLGIDDYHWKRTPRGYPDTEGGLYLEAEDVARIGLLYLRDGSWRGQRLLPEGWVEEATARQAETGNAQGWGYGYQWWRLDTQGVEVWAGLGFGEQYILVLPAYDLIGVVNSWNLFPAPDRDASILTGLRTALMEAVGVGGA
jgi:CubicO group peptidase (beta-lactamase class C family)